MTPSTTIDRRCGLSLILAFGIAFWAPAYARAQEFLIFGGSTTAVWKTQMTVGAGFRAGTPQPQLIGAGSKAEFPGATGAVGVNDDAELNFPRAGQLFSAPLAMNSEISLQHRSNQGMFLRVRAWYDMGINSLDVAHGNVTNAYVSDIRLSDRDFIGAAKFKGIDIYDAYFFGNYRVAQTPFTLRVGRQAVDWGEGLFYPGINAFNPIDAAWATTIGARIANGGKLPVSRIYGNVAMPRGLVVDGFYNLEFRPSVFPGCGTYFNNLDNGVNPGCNSPTTAGLPDQTATLIQTKNYYEGKLYTGGVFKSDYTDPRPMSGEPSRFSGWGIAARQFVEPLKTEIGVYYTGYTSPQFVNAAVVGPTGLDFAINTMFPEGVKSWAVSASGGIRDVALSTQLTRTLDFPTHFNAPLYIIGSNTGTTAFGFMRNECMNRECQTYFPTNITQLQYGGTWQFGRRVGLSDATLTAEADMQWNTNLPPIDGPGAYRLGRYGNFGEANWTNTEGYVCNPGPLSNGIINKCEIDGFVTPFAMGYKIRATTTFPQTAWGLTFTPAITFGHDITGFSADQYTVVGGRVTIGAFLRMDVRQRTFVELNMLRYRAGAEWDPNADRGQYTMVYGINLR